MTELIYTLYSFLVFVFPLFSRFVVLYYHYLCHHI